MQFEFKNYIEKSKFKTTDNNDSNYFMMTGWTLNVPKTKQIEFLTNYYDMIVKKKNKSTILEKPHKEYNQVRIDIDLKYLIKNLDEKKNLKHRYSFNTIKKIINEYVLICSEYFKIPSDGVNFTVFEKPRAFIKGGLDKKQQYIKDGIHILCPDIVCKNIILLAIYEDFINDNKCKDIVSEFKSSEPISKIIDRCVIERNGWFLLGSGKTDDLPENYYNVSKTYNVKYNEGDDECVINEIYLNKNKLEQIIYFSNYDKLENVKLYDDIKLSVIEKRLNKIPKKELLTEIDKIELANKAKTNKKSVDLYYIEHLLDCLSYERVSEYEHWFKIGVCLFNISSNLYTLFEKWSCKCNNYSIDVIKDGVYKEWHNKISIYGHKYSLGLTQLKRFANDDNPKKYNKLVNLEKQKFIDNLIDDINRQPALNKKQTSKKTIGALKMAKKIKKYIEMHCEWNIKCADNTGSCMWYKFENGLWKEDKGANKLHQLFSHEIAPALLKTYDFWNSKYNQYERETRRIKMGGNYNENNENYDDNESINSDYTENTEDRLKNSNESEYFMNCINGKLNTIINIDDFLQKNINRNNLVKDISQEYFDPDFYTQLNENRNVFVCNNCVLDLESLTIRKGLPEDMSTLKTNINFPLNINDDDESIKYNSMLHDLLNKIYPDYEIQEHVLNVLAESLSGIIRREKFHIHTGNGSNGKSVMFDLINIVFGGYSYSPDSTIFSFSTDNPNAPDPTTANCKGKRIINTVESEGNKKLNSNGIKKKTGGDSMTARHLNSEPITFTGQGTWHLCCNDIPDIDYADGGIERRIECIPYESKFVSKNSYTLKNKNKYPYHFPKDIAFRNGDVLKNIAPYLLKLLWDRYIYLSNINFDPLLIEEKIPDRVTKFTNDYINNSNCIDKFINESIENKDGYMQKFTEIFKQFKDYVSGNGENIKHTQFKKHFERRTNKIKKKYGCFYSIDFVLTNQGECYE